jgi:hypothetical protein
MRKKVLADFVERKAFHCGKHVLGRRVDQMGLLRGIPPHHILVGNVLGRSKKKFDANH